MYRKTAARFSIPHFMSAGLIWVLALWTPSAWFEVRPASGDDGPWRSLQVGATPIAFSEDGQVLLQQGTATVCCNATSRLEEAVPGELESRGTDDVTVLFQRRWHSADGTASCLVVDAWAARGDHLEWTVTVSGVEGIWSAPVVTQIHVERDQFPSYWTAWGSREPDANTDSPWSDPLQPAPLTDRRLFFGGHNHLESAAVSLPLVALVDAAGESALGFAHILGEPIVEMELQTTSDGTIRFVRTNHRIEAGQSFHYTVMLFPKLTGFRELLRRYRDVHARYFAPQGDRTWFVTGHGAYSEWEGPLADYELHREGLRFNWKASYDYVYMGMFLPLTDDLDWQWTNARAFGAEAPPFATSLRHLREYSARMRSAGFHVLNYMNATEIGLNIVRSGPMPPRQAAADADLWKDANDFVHYQIPDALLYPRDAQEPYGAWEGGVLADLGVKSYQDFLVDQTRRHMEKLPESSGLCFDRTDYLRLYNWKRDDGVAWSAGAKCGSLALSWIDMMRRIGSIVHEQGKVIFCNPLYRRVDLYEHIDGFYDEIGNLPSSLNLCALMALDKPYVAWTVEIPKSHEHETMQRHLYLGSFLTVPLPQNNHTIKPGDVDIDRLYVDYGLLFESLRGRRWLLEDGAVRTDVGLANAFEIPGGVLAAVVLAGDAAGADLDVRSQHPVFCGEYFLEVLRPGDTAWEPLPPLVNQRVHVPLRYGCALVRAVHSKVLPTCVGLLADQPLTVLTKISHATIRYQWQRDGVWQAPQEYHSPCAIESAQPCRITISDANGQLVSGGLFERQWTVCALPAPRMAPARGYVSSELPKQVAISLAVDVPAGEIRFTRDGSEPSITSPRYEKPLTLSEPTVLKARLFVGDRSSSTAGGEFTQAIAGETLLAESEVLRPGQIWPIDVPIPATIKTIRLHVDDAGDGINCDHADWANSGFVTQPH